MLGFCLVTGPGLDTNGAEMHRHYFRAATYDDAKAHCRPLVVAAGGRGELYPDNARGQNGRICFWAPEAA